MNILLIHSDKLAYETKKKTKWAEEITKGMEKRQLGSCLVCFMGFEEADTGAEQELAKRLADEIREVAGQVGEKTVVLYPYVHLLFGKKPGSAKSALEIMELAEKNLSGLDVVRVPFGYYKAFEIACKGHPLSELSREIKAGEKKEAVSEAVKAEEKLKSEWFVLSADGRLWPLGIKDGRVSGFDFKKHPGLEKLAQYEMAKSRAVEKEPPHVSLMRQLEIADYEPGSDPGNLRYPPNGKMMKALIEELVTRNMHEYGAMEIESPIMYDINHPSLKKYLERFPARQYMIETPNKKVFLRFAACFGQFLMLHDAMVSHRHLPVKLYELTKYSFRVEKHGELTGMRRLRAFTMPDCHAFCADMKQAQEEYVKRFELAKKVLTGAGLRVPQDLEFAIRIVKPVWEQNKKFVASLVKRYGKPALVEMWDKQFFYFVIKYEWNFIDNLGKASALTTDQIDVENAERYNIRYAGADNKQHRPLILHLSPSGAIERVIYALLERAYAEQQAGKSPVLPLWLCPTQVRICPVSDKFNKDAEKIRKEFENAMIRADIDDRTESISRKIRDAERDWIPYTIVFGEKEKKSKTLATRVRTTGGIKPMAAKALIAEIAKQTRGMPFRPLPMPAQLSARPVFIS